MKILWTGMIDAAGICKIYSNAINKYTEHESRVVAIKETRGFDSDIVLERQMWSKPDNLSIQDKMDEIVTIAKDCDVMIFSAAIAPGVSSSKHQVASDTFDVKWHDIDWNDYIDKKKCFVFFPGSTSLRANYDYYINLYKEKKWTMITDQLDVYFDIKKMGHNIKYISVMVNNYLYSNMKINKSKDIIAIHSPTNRTIKNTAEFMRVCRRLSHEYGDFHVNLIENCGFDDSIKIKKGAHLGFDQMQAEDYFCLSSVENSALGLVNFISLSDKAIAFTKEEIGCDKLAWEIVRNEDELYKRMKIYAQDRDVLLDKRLKTYEWHHKYWNDEKLISKLTGILAV